MTRDELWKVYADSNPKLLGDGNDVIHIRLRGLKKMFNTAWDEGEESAFADIARDCRGSNDMPQFMKDLFRR